MEMEIFTETVGDVINMQEEEDAVDEVVQH